MNGGLGRPDAGLPRQGAGLPRPDAGPAQPGAGLQRPGRSAPAARRIGEPPWVRRMLILTALLFLTLFLLVPLGIVFAQAFAKGLGHYWRSIVEPDALSALRLTLLVVALTVPLNVVFGVAAA